MRKQLKNLIIGRSRNIQDRTIFHKLSLIAFLAWVGLGADGITSSCYGPEEAFKILGTHHFLAFFVALATAFTILIISWSYSEIIELFPTGGGGYLVASKLLSPTIGMVSGCALMIDYVLTITVSIASGAAALFSFLPESLYPLKIYFAALGILVLIIMNLRGVKESVMMLVPIFLVFVIAHLFAIIYGIGLHFADLPAVVSSTATDIRGAAGQLGAFGAFLLIVRAYSMGAGTYTGIEAVSNGLPILMEPKVVTAKRTMRYMALSLTFFATGLLIIYALYRVMPEYGKTLNAVALGSMTQTWPAGLGRPFVMITLLSEALLLFVAAQTGFLDGPRILANMAIDHWAPKKFANLSDRFVTQNGVLLMGVSSLAMLFLSKGSVHFLVILYSINVFITFSLSQSGMVKYWWHARMKETHWKRKLSVNAVGLCLTLLILISVIVFKFREGGWITLLITTAVAGFALLIKRHYKQTSRLLDRLDEMALQALAAIRARNPHIIEGTAIKEDHKLRTAVIFVNGFNGLGLYTVYHIMKLFGGVFRNYVFVEIGLVDAANFKGAAEIGSLEQHVQEELQDYVELMKWHGHYAEYHYTLGTDIVDEIAALTPKILERFPHCTFFGGQLVLPDDIFLSRWFHNYTVFAVQNRLYKLGIPVVILPIEAVPSAPVHNHSHERKPAELPQNGARSEKTPAPRNDEKKVVVTPEKDSNPSLF